MNDHIEDDTVQKEIPSFAHTMFVKNDGVVVTAVPVAINKPTETPAALNKSKGKKSDKEPSKKKQKQETSNKSLKMASSMPKREHPQ